MTQMLELSDKDFKAIIVKMFQQANFKKMKKKKETLCKEIEDRVIETNENFKTENTVTEI